MSPIYVPGKVTLRQGFSPVGIGGDNVYEIEVSGTVYRVHVFTTVGESEFIAASPIPNLEYLVVGGGGSGGYANNASAGGGDAGQLLLGIVSKPVGTYEVVVGAGGVPIVEGANFPGQPGANSCFSSLTATGGTGADINDPAGDGAGGGPSGNNGGPGLSSSITGSSVFYAGGGGRADSSGAGIGGIGGGGNAVNGGPGLPGSPNTGGGGGGGRGAGSGNQPGGNGGSGIVIVRYAI